MEENLVYKKLCRFLKEKGAFYRFCVNFSDHSQASLRRRWILNSGDTIFSKKSNDIIGLKEYCNDIKLKEKCVIYAFQWAVTKEGETFWGNINSEWLKEYTLFSKINN